MVVDPFSFVVVFLGALVLLGIGVVIQMQQLIALLTSVQAQLTAFIASVGTPAQIQQGTTLAQSLQDAITAAGTPPPPPAS